MLKGLKLTTKNVKHYPEKGVLLEWLFSWICGEFMGS